MDDITTLVRRNQWLEEHDRIQAVIISALRTQVKIERQAHDRMKDERDMLVRERASQLRPGFWPNGATGA